MATGQLTEWALHLAGQGWHVFPITPGAKKPPMVKDWEHRATTDPDRIRRCWAAGPFNIGIATGPSGLVVIDLDVPDDPARPDGAAQLAALAADRGVQLPDTYTVTTPSGGSHRYFCRPAGVRLRNTQSGTPTGLGPDIDTRAEGGYVVAAGSIVPGGGYELADDSEPAELPAWIVQALCERRSAAISGRPERPNADAERPVQRRETYAAVAVHGETERVRSAPSGEHNAVLSHAAYSLGQLVGAGLLDEPTAARELAGASQHMLGDDCGCTPREIDRVITAGLTAGARRPRRGSRRKDAA